MQLTGNEYRSTMVCIDAYNDSILCGRLSNPCMEGEVPFHGLMQFLRIMDTMLDEMNFPQSFTVKRTFGSITPAAERIQEKGTDLRGEQATFLVKVFFRQNASWQGSIRWMEGEKEESFRSVLEMALLMDSALESEGR